MWKLASYMAFLALLRISSQNNASEIEDEKFQLADLSSDATSVTSGGINSVTEGTSSHKILERANKIKRSDVSQIDGSNNRSESNELSIASIKEANNFSHCEPEKDSFSSLSNSQILSESHYTTLTFTSMKISSTEMNMELVSEQRHVSEHAERGSDRFVQEFSMTSSPVQREVLLVPAQTESQSPINIPESVVFSYKAFSSVVSSESMYPSNSESVKSKSSSHISSTTQTKLLVTQNEENPQHTVFSDTQETQENMGIHISQNLHKTDQDDSPHKPSDDCRFVPFQEWKKRKEAGSPPNDHSMNGVNNSIRKTTNGVKISKESLGGLENHKSPSIVDQGRVYKDKFNYASQDCAATIVQTNSDAKGASSILKEVKDSYLLNKCSTANKFIIIELCQDILVSSVVMGNFELFSSSFHEVRFSVSDRYPVTKEWHDLGQFEAQNIRDVQTFNIHNPLIWARYLKIEILSHFGNEFYCPISLVRVHGKTMMEEFKDTDTIAEPNGSLSHIPSYKGAVGEDEGSDLEQDECKVVTPYLALKEFLEDLNTTEFCDVSSSLNYSQKTTTESVSNRPAQESIFQNIVKRLSLLERNATLSLLYVEEQSKILSDAFFKLETRQVRKSENLFNRLNQTLYTQVLFLEQAVENLRTDSQNRLRDHASQLTKFTTSLGHDASSLTSEISFLKKVVVADTIIILSLLVYVVMTRGTLTVEEITGKQRQNELKEIAIGTPETPIKAQHNRSKGRRKK